VIVIPDLRRARAGLMTSRSRLVVSGRGPGGSCVGTGGRLTVVAALSPGKSEGVRRGSLGAGVSGRIQADLVMMPRSAGHQVDAQVMSRTATSASASPGGSSMTVLLRSAAYPCGLESVR
jgi:hypothetical protein